MDTERKMIKNQSMPSFSAASLMQAKQLTKSDFNLIDPFNPQLDQISKIKIQHNNQRINKAIVSQKNLLQPIKNFGLPTVTNFTPTDSIHTQRPQSILSAKKHESPSQSQTKKAEINIQLNLRASIPVSPKEEYIKVKSQLDEIRHYLSQPNSRLASPNHSPTPRNFDIEKTPEDLTSFEKRIRARSKLENDKSRSQSRFLNKRDTSYITDALSNPSSTVRQTCRENSPLSSREATIVQSPNASQVNIDFTPPKMAHQKSIFGINIGNQTQSGAKRKNTFDVDMFSIDHPPPAVKSEERKIVDHSKLDAEPSSTGSLTTGQTPKFNEQFARNFNTGYLDTVSSTNYLVKKKFKLQRALSISHSENPVLAKVGSFSPFKTSRGFGTKKGEDENTYENDLIATLRKECPNIFSPIPPGRQDVLMLSNWVQEKINDVISSDVDENERCIRCDGIYNLCLNELIRQVSLECVERGELFCKIWTSYYQVLLQFKANINGDYEKEKIAYAKNLRDQNDDFQMIYLQKDKEIENLKKTLTDSQEKIDQMKASYDKLLQKDIKHKDKINQLRRVISHLKTQIEDLKHENRTLTKRQVKGSKKDPKCEKLEGIQGQSDQNFTIGESPSAPRETESKPNDLSSFNISKLKSELEDGKDSINELSKEKEGPDEDSDASTESDGEFEFLDAETNTKIKYNFDQLNSNLVAFRPSRLDNRGAPKFIEVDKEDKDVQTAISLVSDKYNEVFENQFNVDDVIIEKILKKQVDNFAENTEKLLLEIETEQKALQEKLIEKWTSSEIQAQLGNIPEPLLNSIYNITDQVIAESQVEKQPKCRMPPSDGFLSPKIQIGSHNKQNSEPIYISLSYLHKIEDENSKSPRVSILKKNKGEESRPNQTPVIGREETDTKEEEKQQCGTSEDHNKHLKLVKAVKISETYVEKQQYILTNESKDSANETQEEEEIRNDVHIQTENESSKPVVQLRKSFRSFTAGKPEQVSPEASPLGSEFIFAQMMANQRNVGSQDFVRNPQFSEENENKNITQESKKLSIRIALDTSPMHTNHDTPGTLNIPSEKRRSRLSFGINLLEPQKSNLNQEAAKTDDTFSDKARLILLARMYKVEKEKSKGHQNEIENLNEQILSGQNNVVELEATVKGLKVKVKKLEKLKDQCIHKVCLICGDQNQIEDDPKTEYEEKNINEENDEEDIDVRRTATGNDDERDGTEYEEEEGEESDAENTRRSRREKSFKRRFPRQSTVGAPEFKKKKPKEQKVNPSIAIIATIKENGMKKFKNFMPLKSVLKHIFTLYSDRSRDNAIYKDEEFPNFVYTWFLNNFGFKKLAEQKFIVFVLSIKKYLYVVRINLFARFMGLLDGISNHNLDEFTKYLEAMEYVSKLNLGSPIQNTETDTKQYIPYLKGVDYVKYFAETKMGIEEYTEFRKGIEAIKETDPKGINRNGILDFDLLMTKVLAKYRIVCSRTKQHVVTAFKAADLDGNKTCSLKEFIILYRNIETDKYDYWFAETVFNEHADIKVDGEMHLSFDKFTVVCVEYSLFSDAQQDNFLGVQTKEELITEMLELKDKWQRSFDSIQENLRLMTKIPKEDVEYWQSIAEALALRVQATDDLGSQEVKPLLIANKILVQETEKLREQDMDVDLYGIKKEKPAFERTNTEKLAGEIKNNSPVKDAQDNSK